jgi:hypothetical protein
MRSAKAHRWIFLVALAGCLPQEDCGTQPSDYCVSGTAGFLISGPPGSSPCECPTTNNASEVANQRCGEPELVCAIGGRYGRQCACENDLWKCEGYELDLATPRDLSLPDLQTEDLLERD